MRDNARTPPTTPFAYDFDTSADRSSPLDPNNPSNLFSTTRTAKGSSHSLLSSDVESASRKQQQLVSDMQNMLLNFSVVIDNLEGQLSVLDERKVGEKFKAAVDDIAGMLDGFGRDIEARGEGGRREMAREAIRRHKELGQKMTGSARRAASDDVLSEEEQEHYDALDRDRERDSDSDHDHDPFTAGSPPDEDKVYEALTLTPSLMADVSAALRSLTTDEATELTEVAVTVTYIALAAARAALSSFDVALDAEKTGGGNPNAASGRPGSSSLSASFGGVELLDDEGRALPPTPEQNKQTSARGDKIRVNRLGKRMPLVFWPRLAPLLTSDLPAYVVSCFGPVLSVFMFLIMSPGLMVATFLATPLLLADEVLHKTYTFFKTGGRESPRLVQLEQLAHKGYEIGRLYYLVSRLAVKQGVRVVKRQTARRGGVKGLVAWGAGKAVNIAMHPIETAKWVWGVGGTAVEITGGVISAAKDVMRMSAGEESR